MTAKEKRKLGEKLYAASCDGDLEHIKLLLSLGASPNSSSLVKGLYESFKPAKAGMLSPLAGAAGHRQFDVVELLLAEGAELNPNVNISSSSPLHEAVRADDLEIARFFLELGADVNSLNAYNTTALMYAVKYSSAEMVSLLLSFKPDLSQLSFIGAAAVHWAVWPNRPEILELLLKAGADKDHPMADGSTILHCAVKAEHVETVQCLLKWGADPLRKNEEWKTPLEMANEGRSDEIANLLQAAVRRR
jgi:ankyrin repeat protein